MRTVIISILLSLYGSIVFSQSEKKSELPSINIKTLTGETFNTSDIKNPDGPVFLSFWATWCKPCIKELIAVDENYADWQDEFGLKVYAVSVDDAKSMSRVAPFVNGRAWDFEILLDPNSDFKRAMNVINIPHSFILNENGEIIWQHNSYSPGDEDEIYEILKEITSEKTD